MKTKTIMVGLLLISYFSKAQNPGLQVTSGTNGQSGLKFTNINSASPTSGTNGKVLTVDPNGEVILVPDVGGPGSFGGAQNGCSTAPGNIVELGNPMNGVQALLNSDREVPQGGHLLHFSGITQSDKFHVGGNPGWGNFNAGGRFSVENHGRTESAGNYGYGIYAASDYDSPFLNAAIHARASDKSPILFSPNNIGIFSVAEGLGVQKGVLARAVAQPGSVNPIYGLWADASVPPGAFGTAFGLRSSANALGAVAYGIYSECLNATTNNFGGYFNAWQGGQSNYGVWASGSGGTGNNWAGWFSGNFYYTGAWQPSDKRLKKDIKIIENSLNIINKLNPVSYNFDTQKNASYNLPGEKQYGFLSQEVREILPELTKEVKQSKINDENGKELVPETDILTINYNGFIALLTKGMQEQQNQIKEQQKQIDELKALVLSFTDNSTSKKTVTNPTVISLSDKNILVLDQNVPNPFAESTIISYNIPDSFTKAQIIFTSQDGKVIKSVSITEKGTGSLAIFANDLTNGTYSYSLVIDGKTIEAKKMVKE